MTMQGDLLQKKISELRQEWLESDSGKSPWDNEAIGRLITFCEVLNSRITDLEAIVYRVKDKEE